MEEPLGQPLARLEAKLTQMRSELEAAAVVADATEGKTILSEIEAVVAQRIALDHQLRSLLRRARRLGVPVKQLVEVLGMSPRAFFKRYPT